MNMFTEGKQGEWERREREGEERVTTRHLQVINALEQVGTHTQ